MRFNRISSITWERLLLALAMAILAAMISLKRWGYSVDQALYDAAIAQVKPAIGPDILILAIDERSLLELGRWPWPRSVHAQLVDILNEAGVKAIAFDIVFAEPDRANPDHDHRFAEAISAMGRVALLVHMEQTYSGGQILEVLPTPELASAAAALGHVHIEYDVDGVCRSVFLKEGLGEAYWPHLMYALWQLSDATLPEQMPGLQAENPSAASPFLIARDFYNLIPLAGPAARVTTLSYVDVISGRIPERTLRDKIVIVGATAKGLGDIVATPAGPMPGVEFNSNILNSLRNRATLVPVTAGVHLVASVLLVFGLIMAGLRATPRQYLLLTLLATLSLLAASVATLVVLQIWFAPLAAILPILIFYPLWSWRRLEQALRFLRRELTRVEQQASPAVHSTLAEITRKLTFLGQLTGIDDWQLVEASTDKTLAGSPTLLANRDTLAGKLAMSLHIDDELRSCQLLWRDGGGRTVDQQLWLSALANLDAATRSRAQIQPAELVTDTIARLREANQKAEENRAIIDQCLENLQDAVLVANLFGEILFANARARASFTVQSNRGESLMGCLEQLSIEGGWPAVLKKQLHNNVELFAEVQAKGDQKQYFMQLARLPWLFSHSESLLFSFTDITVIKESERVRTEALHFLSHDLRSPVVSILALIEHYRAKYGEQPASQSDFTEILAEIELYARKNLSFAESFLQLARAEMVGDANFDLCDMHSVIDNALLMVRQQALAKSIEVNVDRSMDDIWVWGDGELLERLLINLLSNAIKYSDSNTQIRLLVQRRQDEVDISVVDQGEGISAEQLTKIFERFHRAGSRLEISGAGLGLHFVDTVCNKHGGRIAVESRLGEGSCFKVTLPLCDNEFDLEAAAE
ncbi:CHASE2 domain-containing protein [Halioxenophilus sp. WMMB6]|uniref:CHASE2 domain-containing protein n=1 Tax=Halioxenophilus sp. WMMB6 TaxID=3073815 RepID=UPI00295F0329|nr:CHASE2 domain-containing protein [Halioxenophilus sp. WMMB6]